MKCGWMYRIVVILFLFIGFMAWAEEPGKSQPQPSEKDRLEQACNDAIAARKKGQPLFQEGSERQKEWALSGKSRSQGEEDYVQEVCSRAGAARRVAEEAAQQGGAGPEEPAVGPEGGPEVAGGEERRPRDPRDGEEGGEEGRRPRDRDIAVDDKDKIDQPKDKEPSEHPRGRHPQGGEHPRGEHPRGHQPPSGGHQPPTSGHQPPSGGHGHDGGAVTDEQHSQKLLDVSRKISTPGAEGKKGEGASKAPADKAPAATTPHHFSGDTGFVPGAAGHSVGGAGPDTATGGSTTGTGKSKSTQTEGSGGGDGKGGM